VPYRARRHDGEVCVLESVEPTLPDPERDARTIVALTGDVIERAEMERAQTEVARRYCASSG